MPEQRRDRRLEEHLDCDVHIKGALVPARITDVSRRGLFILFRHPPPVGHVVTLTVHLPGGTMDVMATVQRHAKAAGFADEGAGLVLFALGGHARQRWEAFGGAGSHAPPDASAGGRAAHRRRLPHLAPPRDPVAVVVPVVPVSAAGEGIVATVAVIGAGAAAAGRGGPRGGAWPARRGADAAAGARSRRASRPVRLQLARRRDRPAEEGLSRSALSSSTTGQGLMRPGPTRAKRKSWAAWGPTSR